MMVKGFVHQKAEHMLEKTHTQKPKTGKSLKYTNTNIQLTQKKCLPSLYQNEKITEVLMGKMECQMQRTNKIWETK